MTFLIDFGVKSVGALGIAFLVAFALRRGSAAVRYAMWTCVLAALLVLPLVSSIGPRWNIDRSAWRRATLPHGGHATLETEPSTVVVVEARRPASQSLPMLLWIAGVMAMLARVVAGHWRVRSLFGAAEEIRDARWLAIVHETAVRIRFRRKVILKRSTATDVPLSYGLIQATVLLPAESEQWTEERRRIVLAHEMIHAWRLDSLWGVLAQCALAVNWFNPLAWLAVRRFRREQERSCDDAVILSGTASTVYAGHLVDLVRSVAIPEPALGMAQQFDLEGRVHALLDPGRRRTVVSRKACAGILAAAMVAIMPLAAVRAQSSSSSTAVPSTPVPVRNDATKEVAVSKPVRRPAGPQPSAAPEPQAAPASSVTGSVFDPSGAVIPRAKISLKNTGSSDEEVALSDDSGSYKLQSIPAGMYVLKVRAPGFQMYQKDLPVDAGKQATIDVHLALGEGEESMMITAERSAGAGPANATPQRIRVGGMVQAFNLVRKVAPMYPPDARAEGVEGTVLLRAIISKIGNPLSIVPVSNSVDQRLVSAAIASVSQWQYQPTLLNGEPVEVITTITVSFQLN